MATSTTTLNLSHDVNTLVSFLKETKASIEQKKVDALVDVFKQFKKEEKKTPVDAPVNNVWNTKNSAKEISVKKTLKDAYTTNRTLFFKSHYRNSTVTPCLEISFEGETEKAVKFNVKGNFVWIPKSALTIENGVHLVVKPWFKFSGYAATVFERYSFIAG